MNLQYDRIEQLCQKLNLPAIASQWSHHAQQTLGQDGSYADFVEAILTHEYAARQQRSQQVLMKLSGLPQVKTLEDYDFNYEPYRVCRRLNILRDYSDEKTKLYPRN